MTKTLIGIAIFLLIVVLIVLVAIYSFIRRTVKKFKKTVFGDKGADEDYTRRRQQQYHYEERQSSQGARRQSDGTSQARRTRTSSGEVIIDNRQPEKSGRKIFTEDDGEYVDFVES